MFYELIDRLGTTLNLSTEEAIESEFVKELCTNLIHGHVVVVDTNSNQVFAIKEDMQTLDNYPV